MKFIFCDDETCKHNDNGIYCCKDKIHVCFKETNEFDQGKRICFNACADYEVKENAGS